MIKNNKIHLFFIFIFNIYLLSRFFYSNKYTLDKQINLKFFVLIFIFGNLLFISGIIYRKKLDFHKNIIENIKEKPFLLWILIIRGLILLFLLIIALFIILENL